jgi:hypothetical protein
MSNQDEPLEGQRAPYDFAGLYTYSDILDAINHWNFTAHVDNVVPHPNKYHAREIEGRDFVQFTGKTLTGGFTGRWQVTFGNGLYTNPTDTIVNFEFVSIPDEPVTPKKPSEILKGVLNGTRRVKLAIDTFYEDRTDCFCALGLIGLGLGIKREDMGGFEIAKVAPQFFDPYFDELSQLGRAVVSINDQENVSDTDKLNAIIAMLEKWEL